MNLAARLEAHTKQAGQAILLDAFKDQLAGSIRRLKASKPIAVKTRKVVAAMLTLNKYAPDEAQPV